MKTLLAVIDFIGERFALPLIGLVSLSGFLFVAFFAPRVNEAILGDFREAVRGREVNSMNRATLLLALCAGCAAGDPAAGSGLLPGSRAPGAALTDDAGVDVLALAADTAPALAADVAPAAPSVDSAAPDGALPAFCRGGYVQPCQAEERVSMECGRVRSPPGLFGGGGIVAACDVSASSLGAPACSTNVNGGTTIYVAACADCTACGWTVEP